MHHPRTHLTWHQRPDVRAQLIEGLGIPNAQMKQPTTDILSSDTDVCASSIVTSSGYGSTRPEENMY